MLNSPEIISIAGVVLFWFLIYLFEIKYFLFFLFKRRLVKSKLVVVVHIIAVLGILAYLYGYFIEPYNLEINKVYLKTPKLKNGEIVVVEISDLHLDDKVFNEWKMIKLVNDIDPDVIVFCGDSINVERTLGRLKEVLSQLKAKLGKFAVKGNFDTAYWYNLDLFSGTGFKELDKKTISIEKNGDWFTISGVRPYAGVQKLFFLQGLDKNKYNILLSHYPKAVEDVKGYAIDLVLAGHTHGGQICLPFYGAIATMAKYGKRYESGLYQVNKSFIYVNKGLGLGGGRVPRIRLFCRPEITVFYISAEE